MGGTRQDHTRGVNDPNKGTLLMNSAARTGSPGDGSVQETEEDRSSPEPNGKGAGSDDLAGPPMTMTPPQVPIPPGLVESTVQDCWLDFAPSRQSHSRQPLPSIADRFDDVLPLLGKRKRLGMIARLSVGYYEGWRPNHDEVADLVAVELGVITIEHSIYRRRQRVRGETVDDLLPAMIKRHQANLL